MGDVKARHCLTTAMKSKSAGMAMMKTIFVMMVLGLGTVLFDRDAQKLVIKPIERMTAMVRRLQKTPLGSTPSHEI